MSRPRVAVCAAVVGLLAVGWAGVVAGDAAADAIELTGATLEWSVNEESNTGAFNGQCNFMSGGESDGSAATYRAGDGGATVLKRTESGGYAPVSDHASRCRDASGTTVTPGGTARLGQKVLFSGGSGTLDPSTGAATIAWQGTFSINFYGTLAPFWMSDPVLRVDTTGAGSVTATIGGYASSIDDPDARRLIEPIPGVEVATLRDVGGANLDGFVTTPRYEGVRVEVGESPQIRALPGWGSWPESFVRAMEQLGTASYWYTSGGAADARKPPAELAVAYGTGTTPPTTTTSAPPTTVPVTTVPVTTVLVSTVPPTSVTPATEPPAVARGAGITAGAGGGAVPGPGRGTPQARSAAAPLLPAVVEPGAFGGGSAAPPPSPASGSGPVAAAPALTFTELSARYRPSVNPLAPGSMRVTYRVENSGEVSLRASRRVVVSPTWGAEIIDDAADTAELGPGESVELAQTVTGVWPGGTTRTQVELTPYATGRVPGSTSVAAVARNSQALVPWAQLTLGLVALAVGAAALVRRRRRAPRTAPVPNNPHGGPS